MYKEIHIGKFIKQKVKEEDINIGRITNFFALSEQEIEEMYQEPDLKTDLLLKWSKILGYDFFRFCSQHLILYAPPKSITGKKDKKPSELPIFRKNVYTEEIIKFILELIHTNQKTQQQVMEEYKIPRTTLYRWLKKY
jgi:DNA-binding NtrC family response regulator